MDNLGRFIQGHSARRAGREPSLYEIYINGVSKRPRFYTILDATFHAEFRKNALRLQYGEWWMTFKHLLRRIKLPPMQLTDEERRHRPPSEIPRCRDILLEIALAIGAAGALDRDRPRAAAMGIHGP